MKLDLNCDLGEGEPLGRARALMRWISSANVACGGHAGDVKSMDACARLARQFNVRFGAHPGPFARTHFGRGPIQITGDELELLLLQQVSALQRIANEHRVGLHHVKLHGALYHATENSTPLAGRYVEVVQRRWPGTRIYARAGGRVARLARRRGVVVWEEAFADRAYCDDGSLVPREDPRALIADAPSVSARVRDILSQGFVRTVSGARLFLKPRTLGIHSDTPNAALLARTAFASLRLY